MSPGKSFDGFNHNPNIQEGRPTANPTKAKKIILKWDSWDVAEFLDQYNLPDEVRKDSEVIKRAKELLADAEEFNRNQGEDLDSVRREEKHFPDRLREEFGF